MSDRLIIFLGNVSSEIGEGMNRSISGDQHIRPRHNVG